jgi:hypothetical protein
MVQVVLTPTMLFLLILGGFRAPHTLICLRRQMLSFSAVGGCCGYSKVLKSRGLLILLKLTLVSDEGVYIIVARPKATSYGRTFTVNGRVFTCRHLVDCVTFGADFGRLQPAKQQCGCHGLKRRHSDLFSSNPEHEQRVFLLHHRTVRTQARKPTWLSKSSNTVVVSDPEL